MTSQHVLIVPGLHGSGVGHWQHCWQLDHEGAGLVQQDDWSNPKEAQWVEVAERAIVERPGSLIVAHSLGAILVAKLACSRAAKLVAGALLVAPADITRTSSLHHRSYDFGQMPREALPFPSLVVASHDDPYMPFGKLMALAASWGSRVHDLGHVGHINIQSGFGRWTDGYRLAESVIGGYRPH